MRREDLTTEELAIADQDAMLEAAPLRRMIAAMNKEQYMKSLAILQLKCMLYEEKMTQNPHDDDVKCWSFLYSLALHGLYQLVLHDADE